MGLPACKFSGESAYISVDVYLRLETAADAKHEFTNGQVLAMAGARFVHNQIS
jgi:hypothetical protein